MTVLSSPKLTRTRLRKRAGAGETKCLLKIVVGEVIVSLAMKRRGEKADGFGVVRLQSLQRTPRTD